MVKDGISFKDISDFSAMVAILFSRAERCAIFGELIMQDIFCENVLNWDQWLRGCLLKIIHIFSSSDHFVQRSRMLCAILVEGIMRNISVKII